MTSTTPIFRLFDTETTGLAGAKACEIAWIDIDEQMKVLSTFRSLVNPEKPIEAGATAIHGISDDMVIDAPTIETLLADWPEPFVAVGHNVAFDLRVIGEHVEWNGVVCTLNLARHYIKDSPNHKLETLKHHLKLSEQDSHSALGDCYTCLEVLQYISKLTQMTFSQLRELESKPRLMEKMPFGQHKGKAMRDVPRSYRDFMLAKPDLHRDIRFTFERLNLK